MILRQTANAGVHLAGGFAVGLLIAGVAALLRERRARSQDAPAEPARD
jgi:uncharacterized protein involved in exopolysaccharide biosynthesis